MNLTGSEKLRSVSVADYLAGEAVARRKQEYIDGQIYAMVGGRYAHNLIASNDEGEKLQACMKLPALVG